MKNQLTTLTLLALMAVISRAVAAVEMPEPGPENGGLQLRLVVSPHPATGPEGYSVRVEVINCSESDITLRTGWSSDLETGDGKNFIEAATSIESYPAIAPWIGQVMLGSRAPTQTETVLKPGTALSVVWNTTGRHLKNRVLNPNSVQNPEFALAGGYSVHATLRISRGDREVFLRSNEQLVAIGGKRTAPKHTYGQLWEVHPENMTGTLGLGSSDQIEPGDQFQVGFRLMPQWKLTITHVDATWSYGRLELLEPSQSTDPKSQLPAPFTSATLIMKK